MSSAAERDLAPGPPGSARLARSVKPPATDVGSRAAPGTRAVVQLQGIAGNAAVSALLAGRVVQRLSPGRSIPPPPTPPGAPVPAEHPGFRATQAKVSAAKRQATKHPAAQVKATEAGRAAKPPADDKEAQAKTAKAGEMAAAPAGGFDKAAFIAAVSAAMAKNAPRNLEEADNLAGSGKADAVAAEVKGKVSKSKEASARPMTDASAKTPDTAKAKDKPVEALPPPAAAAPLPALDAKSAMPSKAPAEQTELGGAPAETEAKMAEAEVTEEQLAKSNEPEFTGALEAKKEGEQHSATAPAAFRATEAGQLATAQQGAQVAGNQGAAGMLAVRGAAMAQTGGAQQKTQTKNEARRAEVSGKIRSIFDTTKTAVDAILTGIDPQVNTQFADGEKQAKAAFTAHHTARMDRYKDDRYSGVLGAGRWLRDKIADLPKEVDQFYVEAKQIYETRMKTVISDVADTVGRELTRAKDRIAQGRKEISTYVDGLEPALKSLGNEAATEIGSQFDTLEESVNEKSQSLAEDLAEKYVAARTAVDNEVKALQEANKGLWSKAKEAIGGAIETILKLKNMLLGALARAAGAVTKIIKDPIGFLGNFVNAVKSGVMNFGSNILTHLKKGLQSWLFGTLAEAGIEIPEKFDLKGIVGLILSMLGLTWASIRARLAKVLPEWVLKALETAVEVVKILSSEGVSGLWKWIVQKITDLQEQVMGQIKDFVITKIITAGITWLISLLNPAAAFIKACKMIYDAVMWFVDNAERMSDFVNSVLDSVESIASGGVGKVAGMIEATLGKAIPMVISGLASLLGLGGIAEKIQKILQSIQKPVGKVVDGIIAGVMKYGKKLLGKLKRKKKGATAGADDPAKSAEVRAGATRDLDARLPDGTPPAKVRSVASEVFNTWHPKGLKALEVVSHGPSSQQFDIFITASPKLKASQVTCDVSKDPRVSGANHGQEPEPFRVPVDVALDQNNATMATVSLSWPKALDTLGVLKSNRIRSGDRLEVPQADGTTRLVPRKTLADQAKRENRTFDKTQKGAHAEAAAIDGVKTAWNTLPLAADFKELFGYAPICTFRINVTRSPCPSCASAIVGLVNYAAGRGWEMKAEVSAMALYTPDSNPAEGKAGLATLASAGIGLKVRYLPPADREKLLKENPELARILANRAITLEQEIALAKDRAEVKLGQG